MDRLTSAYRDKPVVQAILDSILPLFQELELEAFKVLNSRGLGTSTALVVPDDGGCCDCETDLSAAVESEIVLDASNAHLDIIGKLVGEPRYGRSDAPYLVAIRVRILVNSSGGLANDLIQITALSVPEGTVTKYVEYDTAFEVSAYNFVGGNELARSLGQARQGGVYGALRTSSWDPTTPGDIVWDDLGYPLTAARGFPDTVDTDYSRLVDLIECTP